MAFWHSRIQDFSCFFFLGFFLFDNTVWFELKAFECHVWPLKSMIRIKIRLDCWLLLVWYNIPSCWPKMLLLILHAHLSVNKDGSPSICSWCSQCSGSLVGFQNSGGFITIIRFFHFVPNSLTYFVNPQKVAVVTRVQKTPQAARAPPLTRALMFAARQPSKLRSLWSSMIP